MKNDMTTIRSQIKINPNQSKNHHFSDQWWLSLFQSNINNANKVYVLNKQIKKIELKGVREICKEQWYNTQAYESLLSRRSGKLSVDIKKLIKKIHYTSILTNNSYHIQKSEYNAIFTLICHLYSQNKFYREGIIKSIENDLNSSDADILTNKNIVKMAIPEFIYTKMMTSSTLKSMEMLGFNLSNVSKDPLITSDIPIITAGKQNKREIKFKEYDDGMLEFSSKYDLFFYTNSIMFALSPNILILLSNDQREVEYSRKLPAKLLVQSYNRLMYSSKCSQIYSKNKENLLNLLQ